MKNTFVPTRGNLKLLNGGRKNSRLVPSQEMETGKIAQAARRKGVGIPLQNRFQFLVGRVGSDNSRQVRCPLTVQNDLERWQLGASGLL